MNGPRLLTANAIAAPWRPVGDDVIGADGRPVLFVSSERPKNRVAIARLAAAAPDLARELATLRTFAADIVSSGTRGRLTLHTDLVTKIARADAALSAAGWPLEVPS